MRLRLRTGPFLFLLYFVGSNKAQVNAHPRDGKIDSLPVGGAAKSQCKWHGYR